MKKYAIIVAGGKGSRMGAEVPKQFLLLSGKPLLMHTLERFLLAVSSVEIILALPENEITEWSNLCEKFSFKINHHIVTGGKTRFDSVKNCLALVTEKSVVAVHDGVRPFASPTLISKCFDEAEKNENAVPCIPVNESLRKITDRKNEIADRSGFVIIQTPQCFQSDVLLKAYQQPYKESFTDDAAVVESTGKKIFLTEGERTNIKITYPFDFEIAEAMLKKI